jgi:hypothetical protein
MLARGGPSFDAVAHQTITKNCAVCISFHAFCSLSLGKVTHRQESLGIPPRDEIYCNNMCTHPTVNVITAYMIIIRHDGGEIIMWSINTKKNRWPTNRAGPWSLDYHKQWKGEVLPTETSFPLNSLGRLFCFILLLLWIYNPSGPWQLFSVP